MREIVWVLQDVLYCSAEQFYQIFDRTGLTGRAVPQCRTTGQARTKQIVL